METSEKSTRQMCLNMTSSWQDSHVKMLVLPENEKDFVEREVVCSLKSSGYYEKNNLGLYSLKMLEDLSSNKGWDFARVLIELENVGYTCEWQIFNSKNHGVPQNRERVFIIGHLRGAGTRPIFPITENNRPANDVQGPATNTITTRYGQSYATGSYIVENRLNTSALNNPTHSNDRIYDPSGVSPALNCAEGGNRQPLIVCDSGQERKDQMRSDVIAPLRANTGAGYNNIVVPKTAGCLTGGGHSDGHHSDMTILKTTRRARRLTPVECERLQGFPDGWTEGISDTQRYKCLGNAVTVNVVEFIAEYIMEMLLNDHSTVRYD